ncbi:MAG: SPFH domain-containing protein [Dehalococcoidia bacterium]|nr:SPFH domain-containing protein [Dehalococcoidia bacterium]
MNTLGIVGLGIIGLICLYCLLGFFLIGASEVGILTKKMLGKKMPKGQIIARAGEIGIQADTLAPGLYWRFPLFWKIKKVKVVIIEPGKIGVVKAIDGKTILSNRLLGDEVECNSFQDARAFLSNGGYRGPQVGILTPGAYRINISAFEVSVRNAVTVGENQIGVGIALDGIILPTNYVIAPKPSNAENFNLFQGGQDFLDKNGYRGPQLDTIQPGTYYINPLLFDVKIFDIVDVPPGYVAVIRSNVGAELEHTIRTPVDAKSDGAMKGVIHDRIETLLTTDKFTRGIWEEPVAPGKYNLNPIAYTPYMVPTSAVTIDWASEGRIGTKVHSVQNEGVLYKFDPLKVTSKDGFQLGVNIRMIIRIPPKNAAFVIQRFGSIDNLIDQIVHPLIDSSFRNKAGEKRAIDFFQSREDIQRDALEHAVEVFDKYNIDAQNLLVAYIDIPKDLLDTQTKKEIAIQQKEQFNQEAEAQERLIAVKEKSARAEMQQKVIDAELSIDIHKNMAKALVEKAKGDKDAMIEQARGSREAQIEKAKGEEQAIRLVAEANAHKSIVEGKGIAEAYEVQKKAIGQENVYMIELMKEISRGGIKIVPEIMVGEGKGGLVDAALANLLKKDANK